MDESARVRINSFVRRCRRRDDGLRCSDSDFHPPALPARAPNIRALRAEEERDIDTRIKHRIYGMRN